MLRSNSDRFWQAFLAVQGAEINLPGSCQAANPESFQRSKAKAVAEFETSFVRRLLEGHQGNITRAVGVLIAPNQVLFRNCFDSLDADVRFTYERGAFHQDVVLREAPDLEQLGALGFSLKTTRLEIWTEFLTAPTPKITRTAVESETDPALRSQMVDPDVVEERLDFGLMDMPSGKAYLQEGQSVEPVRVLKQWLQINGRTFLVESIDLPTLEPLLASLRSPNSNLAARAKRLDRFYTTAMRHHRVWSRIPPTSYRWPRWTHQSGPVEV